MSAAAPRDPEASVIAPHRERARGVSEPEFAWEGWDGRPDFFESSFTNHSMQRRPVLARGPPQSP